MLGYFALSFLVSVYTAWSFNCSSRRRGIVRGLAEFLSVPLDQEVLLEDMLNFCP